MFPDTTQSSSVTDPPLDTNTPPPRYTAEFCDTVQPTSFGDPEDTYTPPPYWLDVFPVITHPTSVGLLDCTYTPPPYVALPPRSVKPSSTAPAPF